MMSSLDYEQRPPPTPYPPGLDLALGQREGKYQRAQPKTILVLED